MIVGGCGRLGSEIATQLSSQGHDVVVLDVEETAFDRLGSAFNGEMTVGDVTDRDTLEAAGVAMADGLLAVTRFDNANLMAVEIATHLYDVPRSVARLFNPEREASYQKLGVRYVSATALLAKEFLNELQTGPYKLHVQFEDGDVEVVDMRIGPDGDGMLLEDFEAEGELRVTAVERNDRVFVPEVDDRLQRHDVVVGALSRGAHRNLTRLLEPAPGGEDLTRAGA